MRTQIFDIAGLTLFAGLPLAFGLWSVWVYWLDKKAGEPLPDGSFRSRPIVRGLFIIGLIVAGLCFVVLVLLGPLPRSEPDDWIMSTDTNEE